MEPLRFEISGDFITNFAREKYKETNDVSVGVNVLTTALVGFPKDLATSIVLGNKKLVGVAFTIALPPVARIVATPG